MDFYGNQRFYVYGYFMPGDWGDGLGPPLYIGKGQGDRCRQHLRPKEVRRHNQEFHNFVQLLKWQRLKPEVVILYDWLTEQQAYDHEQFLISHFGRRDIGTGCLFNKCDGGNGGLSIGYRHPPEMIERLGEIAKARWQDPKMRDKITRGMKATGLRRPYAYRPRPHLCGPRETTRPLIHRQRNRWVVRQGDKYICNRDLYCEAVKAVAAFLKGEPVERKKRPQGQQPARRAMSRARLFQRQMETCWREAEIDNLRYAREQARAAKKPTIRLSWDKQKKGWRVTVGGSTQGTRSLYCDALQLVREIRREQETGIPRVRGKRGHAIRPRQR